MVKDTILYDRLELGPGATEEEIKKAYRKLSKQWHPDRHVTSTPEVKADITKKYQDIIEAKEILLDNDKRKLYDKIGIDILKAGVDNQTEQGANPFADFGNIFGQGFPFNVGGPSGMGMGQRRKENEDINDIIEVTLEQIYNEETINFTYKQKNWCQKCDGEGSKDGKSTTCSGCDGKGVRIHDIRMGPMIQRSVGECNVCKGKGKIIPETNKCDTCNGKCYIVKDKTIQIPLKSGLTSGNKINLSGKGNQFKNLKSDLILTVVENPHSIFKRLGNNLVVEVSLKLYQALFGFDKIITHLDGRKLHISSSGKTDFESVKIISGEGLKSLQNIKGDLIIKFLVELPNFSGVSNESKAQLKLLLQSFEKSETQSEFQIQKTPGLVKTVLVDCDQEQRKLILNAINNSDINSNNSRFRSSHNPYESDDHTQTTQCSQQ